MHSSQQVINVAKMNDEQILDMIFSKEYVFHEENMVKTKPIDPLELQTLKQLELEAMKLTESGNHEQALGVIEQAILINDEYGSAYNNRAQIHRIRGDIEKAIEDLELAIKHGDRNTLKQAYTQRGIIRKERGDTQGSEEDFQLGAKYGNDIAKKEVANNPYAKMCNAILSQVMKEEMK